MDILYILYGAAITFALYWACIAIVSQCSPRYRLWRKHKSDEQYRRNREKSRSREAAREASELKWAEAHPDHPLAKLLLETKATQTKKVPTGSDESDEPEGLALLRKKQADDDAERQRMEDWKQARELEAQQMLEFSLANPSLPESRHYLEKRVDEATKQLKDIDSDIKHCKAMMRHVTHDELETAMYATRLSEAESQHEAVLGSLRRIQAALDAPVMEDSEQ
jgi:hypothetical protein